MTRDRLRITRGLLFTVDADGDVWVWQPHRREHIPLIPDALSLLLQFGGGRTVAEAAAAASIELDDTVVELVERLIAAQLLVPVDKPMPPPSRPVAQHRIDELVDRDSFVGVDGAPIVTGFARVDGRRIAVASWDDGADGGIEHVLALQERVLADPCPIVYLLDRCTVGADPSAFHGPRAIGRIYANQARLSGTVPQIAIVEGALVRPAALLPVGCDLVIFVEPCGQVSLADSMLVKELIGEEIAADALGGARVHAEHSGLAHLLAPSSQDASSLARRYLALMPAAASDLPPITDPAPAPALAPSAHDQLVPDDADTPFAISELVRTLLDEGSLLELRPRWARELSTTLGRLDGVPIGVVANCSQRRAGILTVEAADKAARFIATCDAYGLPVLFVVDALGFEIGRAAERAGIERAAGRMLAAVATARVPKLTLVARRAHTSGLFAMCGPALDPDVFLALPTASISVTTERGVISGVSTLERRLDGEARASLRGYLRAARRDPSMIAEVVSASQARDVLATRLRARLAITWARNPRPIPA